MMMNKKNFRIPCECCIRTHATLYNQYTPRP